MLCTINDTYYLADGTFSGGQALTNLRLKIERVFDTVVELNALNPVLYDRGKRKADITFSVQRVQDTIKDADIFILDHETTVPRTGDIKLIAAAGGGVVALIVNGNVLSNELVKQTGKFTEHSYRIVGSLLFAPTPTVDTMLLETGDFILLETGDKILLEV